MCFPKWRKDKYKRNIDIFVRTYFDRIAPVYEGLEIEVETKSQEFFDETGMYFNPESDDPEDWANRATEYEVEYWQNLTLMRYNTRLMTVSTLYQLWEQQLRQFLYEEITRLGLINIDGDTIEFKTFCTRSHELKSALNQLGIDTNRVISWVKTKELRLLQNVIKHGDGGSARELELIRPDFFLKNIFGEKNMDLNLTTLNEETLDVDDSEILGYGEVLKMFWDELSENIN